MVVEQVARRSSCEEDNGKQMQVEGKDERGMNEQRPSGLDGSG